MSGKFEPKVPVQLDPPKSDPISLEALAAANGKLNVWRPSHQFLGRRLLELCRAHGNISKTTCAMFL